MRHKGLFITGTDTGVGKTLISGAIARSLVKKGIHCGVMKPIESGCRVGKKGLIPQDGRYLQQAAHSKASMEQITPYRFQKPLAPYAAMLSGESQSISFSHILESANALLDQHDFLIVEGVGGLLAPLTQNSSVMDLIRLFNFPVLLVGRSGLGTLNHTLLSLRYGAAEGLSFAGVILNQSAAKPDLSEKTNVTILDEQTQHPIWGPFPFFKTKGGRARRIEKSAALLDEHDSLKTLIQQLL